MQYKDIDISQIGVCWCWISVKSRNLKEKVYREVKSSKHM
jgi:hypothetical protein